MHGTTLSTTEGFHERRPARSSAQYDTISGRLQAFLVISHQIASESVPIDGFGGGALQADAGGLSQKWAPCLSDPRRVPASAGPACPLRHASTQSRLCHRCASLPDDADASKTPSRHFCGRPLAPTPTRLADESPPPLGRSPAVRGAFPDGVAVRPARKRRSRACRARNRGQHRGSGRPPLLPHGAPRVMRGRGGGVGWPRGQHGRVEPQDRCLRAP